MTHDARTTHYPDPLIKVNDTIQIDLETGKIIDFIKFDTGNLCMVTGGANIGRIGVITNRERERDILALLMWCMSKMPMTTALPLGSPTCLLLEKAINHGFLFPEGRESASPLLKRETRHWLPSRAVDEKNL